MLASSGATCASSGVSWRHVANARRQPQHGQVERHVARHVQHRVVAQVGADGRQDVGLAHPLRQTVRQQVSGLRGAGRLRPGAGAGAAAVAGVDVAGQCLSRGEDGA